MEKFRSLIRFIGRASLSLIFILSSINKMIDYQNTALYMTNHGVPYVEYLLPAAIVIEILCGFSLLFGRIERTVSTLLALYLIPVTYFFHNFIPIEDPTLRTLQFINFMKNLAIFGGLLCIASEKKQPKQKVENQ